jgi:hypothetical protein
MNGYRVSSSRVEEGLLFLAVSLRGSATSSSTCNWASRQLLKVGVRGGGRIASLCDSVGHKLFNTGSRCAASSKLVSGLASANVFLFRDIFSSEAHSL